MTTMTFPERLAFAMKRASLNQSELGRALGVTPQAIQNLLARNRPTYNGNLAKKMGEVLQVPVAWLAFGEGTLPEEPLLPVPAVPATAEEAQKRPAASGLSTKGLSSLQIAGLEKLALLMRAGAYGDDDVIDLLQTLKPRLAALKEDTQSP